MRKGTLVGRPELRDPGVHADPREGGTDVQTGGALQGANTIPPRGRLNALLAVAAVLAIAATREAAPAAGAGTAVVHVDSGIGNRGLSPGYAPVHDDAGNLGAGLAPGYGPGSYQVGIERPTARTAAVHDDAGHVNR